MKYVRCNACGFVTDEKAVHGKCPACGVNSTAFEPYESRVSERREGWLRLDVHPILVHFPQAFIISLFLLLVSSRFFGEPVLGAVLACARVMIVVLPALVVLAIVSGLVDGKVRFRKVTTPALTKKLFIGIATAALSAAMVAVFLAQGFAATPVLIGLSAGTVSCSVGLGLIGASLTCSKLPG
ncbi:MAG: rubrerythrin [Spirochaetes bacterium]|nr:rubrerythrin [Spirochaetota bacterium]